MIQTPDDDGSLGSDLLFRGKAVCMDVNAKELQMVRVPQQSVPDV